MDNYKPNSQKSREEVKNEPHKEKVISGAAKPQQKNEFQKFVDDFANDSSNALKDIFIASIKGAISSVVVGSVRAIADMITSSVNNKLGDPNKGSSPSGSRVSYQRYYDNRDDFRSSRFDRRETLDYDNIIFAYKSDAERVLNTMNDSIKRFGLVSVGDLYDFADIPTSNYMVGKYGWMNLSTATIVPVRDGYLLKLPRALALD